MKRVLTILVFSMLLGWVCYASSGKPNVVIATCSMATGSNQGIIYPEIAIDADGSWRQAKLSDFWKGQRFRLFDPENQLLGQTVTVSKVPNDNLVPVYGESKQATDTFSFGIYSSGTPVTNKGISLIKPRNVAPAAEKEFLKKQTDIKKILANVVKLDWENIKKDFPTQKSTQVNSFMVVDIDGNKLDDYVLILGEDFGEGKQGPAAIILYLNKNGRFERIPIGSWSELVYNFPILLFAKDFNGDKLPELFIGTSDADTTVPYVYSWSNAGLMLLYKAKEPFWGG